MKLLTWFTSFILISISGLSQSFLNLDFEYGDSLPANWVFYRNFPTNISLDSIGKFNGNFSLKMSSGEKHDLLMSIKFIDPKLISGKKSG